MSQDKIQAYLEDDRQYGRMKNDDFNQNYQQKELYDKNGSHIREIKICSLNGDLLPQNDNIEGLNSLSQDIDYSLYTQSDQIDKEDYEGCIFSEQFERDCPDACVIICNTINQYTKTNVKATISKNDRFCLQSEVINDCQHYINKYEQNLKRIVNEFIIENYKKSSDPKRQGLIELGINYQGNQSNDKDLSDYIFSNIGILRKQIKELNKLM